MKKKLPSFFDCIALLSITIVLLFTGTVVFKIPIPLLLIISASIAGIKSFLLGHNWSEIESSIVNVIKGTLPAIMILLTVGILSGGFIASGTIPPLIDYGLRLIHPTWILPAAYIVCCISSLVIGSSWTTAATIGVALVGMADAMNVSPAICAGAVVSGAYFGDKLSPLSDTTNLAPGVSDTDLFSHIRAMMATTIPAWGIALIGFIVANIYIVPDTNSRLEQIGSILHTLESSFNLHPVTILPLACVIIMALLRFPAVVILLSGSFVAILIGWLVQSHSLISVLQSAYSGYSIDTDNEIINNLLNRGGIVSFLETTLIILCATGLGGIWESGGYITSLHDNLLHKIKTNKMLIIATVVTATISNIIMAEQYLSIVITGRIYKDAYKRKKLQPFMLSRSLEDGGTVTSALVPWNSCGAFMSSALGVSTVQYLPFAFFNLVMPTVAIVLTALGLFIYRKKEN
ncbi:MAG: Na+/H+ antiporter NhaC [Spirochaetes bacterium]|nr:Na+/H+ antiporter NhaC [Spirochaetota bacterium]